MMPAGIMAYPLSPPALWTVADQPVPDPRGGRGKVARDHVSAGAVRPLSRDGPDAAPRYGGYSPVADSTSSLWGQDDRSTDIHGGECGRVRTGGPAGRARPATAARARTPR